MLFVKLSLVLGVLFAVVLVGCGGASTDVSKPVNPALAGRRIIAEQPGESQSLPRVHVPTGPPPKHLVIKELKVGTGPGVKPTDAIAVAYEGVAYKTAKRFDFRARSEPFFFQTGVERVTPGFDRAVVGMKVGGRREVIIPPKLTFNELGKPETLVYVIDLLLDESAAEYHYRLKHGISLPLPGTIEEAQQSQ